MIVFVQQQYRTTVTQSATDQRSISTNYLIGNVCFLLAIYVFTHYCQFECVSQSERSPDLSIPALFLRRYLKKLFLPSGHRKCLGDIKEVIHAKISTTGLDVLQNVFDNFISKLCPCIIIEGSYLPDVIKNKIQLSGK